MMELGGVTLFDCVLDVLKKIYLFQMIRRHFEWYKMLLKIFTFLFLIGSIPVSEGCADLSFSNSSYNFYVENSFKFSLR